MAKVNRICKTCEKSYSYCGNCGNKNSNPAWMSTWCSENCKKVFQICSNYKQGVITREAAKKRLEKECNMRLKYTFKKSIRDIIDEIYGEDADTLRSGKKDKLFERKTDEAK